MKKVLFVIPTLRSGGGVIRGLQNMLALLPKDRYIIDVLPMGYSDSNNVELSNCRVLSDNFWLTAITAIYSQTTNYSKRFLLKLTKLLLFALSKIKCRNYFANKVFQSVAHLYSGYDVVIAYQEGPCTCFTQYINASYKIAWIHCDYREYRKIYTKSEEHIYSKYHHIVCVSQYTLQVFRDIYPMFKERSLYIYNVLNKDYIYKSAEVDCEDVHNKYGNIQLISLGRLHPVKQFSIIPYIIKKMIELGANDFHWILIGDGAGTRELENIYKELERQNVSEKYFSYLGSKFNPYPYIKNSDILVSTSLSEACPFVVNEARVLGVPVVSNNYPSIFEFIVDGKNGRISSIENLANILAGLVIDKKSLKKLEEGMKAYDYDNDAIISNIIKLIDKNETFYNKN